MGSMSKEVISLEMEHQNWSPKPIGCFLREISMVENAAKRQLKLEDYASKLEEELRKIEVFKRELPLCMILVKDAIAALKEKVMSCTTSEVRPVIGEFMSLKSNSDGDEGVNIEKDCRDKKNWMSSAQLWSCNSYSDNGNQQKSLEVEERFEEDRRSATDNPFRLSKRRNGEGAFVPFKKSSASLSTTTTKKDDTDVQSVPSLSLLTPGIKNPSVEPSYGALSSKTRENNNRALPSSSSKKVQPCSPNPSQPQQQQQQQQNSQKKQRRCWSAELHRRFVSALQELGGSQVATPKQIRELMKVDGLTNDEVKSHLQKYRLHTRRTPSASTTNKPSAVVLGDLWVSKDEYGISKESNSSRSPESPFQLATKGLSSTGGNSMEEEEEEDEISESNVWNGDDVRKQRDEEV